MCFFVHLPGFSTRGSPAHRLVPQQQERQHDHQLLQRVQQRQLHQEGKRRRLEEPLHRGHHQRLEGMDREGDQWYGHPHQDGLEPQIQIPLEETSHNCLICCGIL